MAQNRKHILLAVISSLLVCTSSFAQTYKPPVFTDPERLKKIEATYPIIDKIYKDYAEQNHFPGWFMVL